MFQQKQYRNKIDTAIMASFSGVTTLTDIAVNLDEIFDEDWNHVLLRARENNVGRIIITGVDLEVSKNAIKFCRQWNASGSILPRLYTTVGLHPTNTKQADETGLSTEEYEQKLLEVAIDGMQDKTVVFIGECGLDYDRFSYADLDTQKKWFLMHLNLSRITGLPLFLHERNTNNFLLNWIKESGGIPNGAVVHSFTGNMEDRDNALALPNVYISINGCSLRTIEQCDVISGIPLDKILFETDAPWCSIKPTSPCFVHTEKLPYNIIKRKKGGIPREDTMIKDRNEPVMVTQVIRCYAALTQSSIECAANCAEENIQKLLGKFMY